MTLGELRSALRFLTRLPLPAAEPRSFGAAAFPLVGLLLGAMLLAVDAVPLAARLRDVAILAASAIATGAIHYDGLADTLDALGGSTREQRLRIMRDGSFGVFAALGLIVIAALELAALGELAGRARMVALLAAPVLGRWAMVLSGFRATSAREEGLGASFAREVDGRQMAVATLTALGVAVILAGGRGMIVCSIVATSAAAVRGFARSRFGGVTGDVLGGAGLLGETLALVLFAAT